MPAEPSVPQTPPEGAASNAPVTSGKRRAPRRIPPVPTLPAAEAARARDRAGAAPERPTAATPSPRPRIGPAVSDAATSAEAAEDVLVMQGITKSFGGRTVVEDIDLVVPAGTFFGLVGPNGAGKTTTLSMIAGLLRADAGTIRVHGIDVAADPARTKRMIGILPDRLRTFDRLTGRQLLYYDGVLRGLDAAVVRTRIEDLVRAFDLADVLERTVSDCSTGSVRKLLLAGAVIHSPRLLVLDEPFEAVDPVSSAVILDVLDAYVRHGGSVILSSHGMDLVQQICSRVAVMVDGRIAAQGPTSEVRDGATLQERFLELTGPAPTAEDLEWLQSFSE